MNEYQPSEKELQDQAKAFRDYFEYEERRALKMMFNFKNLDCDFREQNIQAKCFYWIKAVICLALRRTHGSYLGDTLTVISYDEYQCYESLNWRSVWVTRGIFTGWSVCCCSDGT
jgi:hypothetical protein